MSVGGNLRRIVVVVAAAVVVLVAGVDAFLCDGRIQIQVRRG